MNRQALIVYGGWEGHEPEAVAELFRGILQADGFTTVMKTELEALGDAGLVGNSDLVIPIWTMGQIDDEAVAVLSEHVANGVGLAGCHGGMCDAFRGNVNWHFLTGGQWVAHPGNDGVNYRVEFRKDIEDPIIEGLPDFEVSTEQYYMHVDPANQVLATTDFPVVPGPHDTNGRVKMPVVWKRRWGNGRQFYCSLGHQRSVLERDPLPELMRRGFRWAAGQAL